MRPKSDKGTKLDQYLIVRLTQKEKAEIDERCKVEHFSSMSDYTRSRLFKKRLIRRIVFPAEYRMDLHSLDYDLVKIGTNLNQIAKRLNTYNTAQLTKQDLSVFMDCNAQLKNCFATLEKYLIYL